MRRLAVVLSVLLVTSLALAQAPAGPPKPGPEHKRLEYFVGKWTGEGTMKESVFGPAGKMTATETCQWYTGGFALVCNSTGKMEGLGEMKAMSIMTYNPETKLYSYSMVDSMGNSDYATGTVKDKTWTWTNSGKKSGKAFKATFILTEDSATSYSYKWSASVGGGPMATLMEGKSTRAR